MTQLAKGDRVRVKAGLGHQYGRIEDAVPDMKGRVLVRLGNDLERKSLDRLTRIGGSPPIPPAIERRHSANAAERRHFAPQPKQFPTRDRKHLDSLKRLACAHCGADALGCDPSHHGPSGTSSKASDHDALPECRDCHDRWGNKGSPHPSWDWMTKEQKRERFKFIAGQYRERWER